MPSPSYPIHIWGPILAGAGVHYVRMGPGQDFFANMRGAYEQAWPRPRVIVTSFPHNPTTACVDLEFMTQLVEFARERDIIVVHDFAYADLGFDGYEPPSILQVPGAKDVAVELYTLTKSFSMAGWRMGFLVGNAEIVAALAKLKSYLDYGSFQPIQIAATVAMNEAPDFPKEVNEIYRGRRDALIDGLGRIGWHIERPKGTMFVWAHIPEPYAEMTSLEFATMCVQEGRVALSPGIGIRPRRRRLRAVRARRERAAHHPSHPPAAQRPHQTRLTRTRSRTCVTEAPHDGTLSHAGSSGAPSREAAGHVHARPIELSPKFAATQHGVFTLRATRVRAGLSRAPDRRRGACVCGCGSTRASSGCRAQCRRGRATFWPRASRPASPSAVIASISGGALRASRRRE